MRLSTNRSATAQHEIQLRPKSRDLTANFDAAKNPTIAVPGTNAPNATYRQLFFLRVEFGRRRRQLRCMIHRHGHYSVRGSRAARQHAVHEIAGDPGGQIENLGSRRRCGQNGARERNSNGGGSLPIHDVSPLSLAIDPRGGFGVGSWLKRDFSAVATGTIGAQYCRLLQDGCGGRSSALRRRPTLSSSPIPKPFHARRRPAISPIPARTKASAAIRWACGSRPPVSRPGAR
jgi:hypothetical protein